MFNILIFRKSSSLSSNTTIDYISAYWTCSAMGNSFSSWMILTESDVVWAPLSQVNDFDQEWRGLGATLSGKRFWPRVTWFGRHSLRQTILTKSDVVWAPLSQVDLIPWRLLHMMQALFHFNFLDRHRGSIQVISPWLYSIWQIHRYNTSRNLTNFKIAPNDSRYTQKVLFCKQLWSPGSF